MKSFNFGYFSAALLVATACIPMRVPADDAATSRVYVVAYRCTPNQGAALVALGDPVVDLYDQAFYGDAGDPVSIKPSVTVTKATTDTVEFYFDVHPGNYDASIRLPMLKRSLVCGRNGPLVVLPGRDRHLFVAAMTGSTDWHAPGAVAGTLPIEGVDVSVLVYGKADAL